MSCEFGASAISESAFRSSVSAVLPHHAAIGAAGQDGLRHQGAWPLNEKTIVAVNAAVPCQSFSAGQVLHRERKRVRSLRVLVLLDTSTTSRILTNQSTRPTIVRYPPDAGQRRGKQTCSEARHSVKSTGELLQSDPGEINGFRSLHRLSAVSSN